MKKRAILISVAAYLTSFLLGVFLVFALGLDFTQPGPIVWFVTIGASLLVSAFAAWWYFRFVEASAREGFGFGLVLIATSFAIELVIYIVPMIVLGRTQELAAVYGTPWFWITLPLVLGATTLVGMLSRKG